MGKTVFAFAGSRWLDRSSVIMDGDKVYLLNYISSRRTTTLIEEAKKNDGNIVVQASRNEFQRCKMVLELIALDMKKMLVK